MVDQEIFLWGVGGLISNWGLYPLAGVHPEVLLKCYGAEQGGTAPSPIGEHQNGYENPNKIMGIT